ASSHWQTDYKKAVALAKKQNKLLLIDFTGSDWCVWCQRLDGEVFSKPEFKKWADEKCILVKLDFPRKKELPPEVKEWNEKFARRHGVQGFPTIVVLDAHERAVARLGYAKGGPSAWIKEADKAINEGSEED